MYNKTEIKCNHHPKVSVLRYNASNVKEMLIFILHSKIIFLITVFVVSSKNT